MVTLTTQENIQDLAVFHALFKRFLQRIRTVVNFRYVAVPELQKRGAIHLHIVVPTRQDYRLLWSVWTSVVGGIGKARVDVTKGIQRMDIHRVASYLAKYVAKAFEEGELNKKRYWASQGIGEPQKTVFLLPGHLSLVDAISHVLGLLEAKGMCFSFRDAFLRASGSVFWMATGGQVPDPEARQIKRPARNRLATA